LSDADLRALERASEAGDLEATLALARALARAGKRAPARAALAWAVERAPLDDGAFRSIAAVEVEVEGRSFAALTWLDCETCQALAELATDEDGTELGAHGFRRLAVAALERDQEWLEQCPRCGTTYHFARTTSFDGLSDWTERRRLDPCEVVAKLRGRLATAELDRTLHLALAAAEGWCDERAARLERMIESGSVRERPHAAAALAEHFLRSERQDRLEVLARHGDADVRLAAVRVAARRSAKLAQTLADRIRDADPRVRAAAIGAIGTSSRGALAGSLVTIVRALRDPDPQIRRAAATAAGRAAKHDLDVGSAVEDLARMLGDSDPLVVDAALAALEDLASRGFGRRVVEAMRGKRANPARAKTVKLAFQRLEKRSR
jgi:hypothetical protein